MSKARNIADAFDANGDVAVSALDNVPPNTALVDSSDNTVLDTSSGVLSANGQIVTGADGISMQDGERIYLGNSDDLQIYHDGTHSRIVDSGAGSLVVQATDLIIQDGGSTEQMARFYKDAQVDLSYNGSTRLSTTSTGAKVWGDLTVSGDIIGGGKVLQVVQGYTSAKAYITSSGYVWQDAATITPTSTSSKILVMFNLAFGRINLNGGLKLVRNDGYFMPNLGGAYLGGATAAQGAFNTADDGLTPQHDYSIGMYPVSYLDSPSSTSPQSYGVYVYFGNTGYVPFNRQYNDNGGYACSTVTLMEIAG